MSLWKLATASLRHFWRTNLALLLGIAIGTAVLTGALIVGDSIRHSLKTLTIERLGHIEEILIGEHFFGTELAGQLDATIKSDSNSVYDGAVPAILINQATLESTNSENTARTQGVSLVGANAEFWELSMTKMNVTPPGEDEIIINQSLADELGAKIGDEVILHVGKAASIASDSALARKSDLVKTIVDLRIVNIIPATGLGRFSLQASQQVPANAFVALETLQAGLDQEEKINAVLIARRDDEPATEDAFDQLAASLQPSIADLGLQLKRVSLDYTEGGETKTMLAYDTLTNDRMLFAPEHDSLIAHSLKAWGAQPSYTYLATKMQRVDTEGEATGKIVPYSTITGIDSQPTFGPLINDDHEAIAIADDEIVLNEWTAVGLEAKVGDTIRVTFFEPETTHGDVVEQSADFKLIAVVPITEPDKPFDSRRRRDAVFTTKPTLVNDPDLTPQVKGITDAETIDQWDAPFPMDRKLLSGRDDNYWLYYRTTPKAFVSLAAGRRLWASRFGDTTSYRIPIDKNADQTVESRTNALAAKLGADYEQFGMHWIRAKSDGLEASSGTTPFDVLFFLFSQFIIASALMLVALLLRLGLEQRASQIGLVGALGFNNKRSFRLLLAENGLIILLGSLLGVILGIGYAWLMLAGLRTWWVDAVVTPFMQMNVSPTSLIVGFLLGVIASLLTVIFTLRRLRKVSVWSLMTGKTEDSAISVTPGKRSWLGWMPQILLLVAFLLSMAGRSLPPEQQGGIFFGSGALALIAMLMGVSSYLRKRGAEATDGADLDANSLAVRNLTRNPTRSALTIGLVASACFLIVALSAFRLSPTDGGTGGFDLIGTSDQPIFESLPAEELPPNTKVFSLRMQDGDDASCRNLYQSKKPRLIGITQDFIDGADTIGIMDWAGVDSSLADDQSKWQVLSANFEPTGNDDDQDAIPVVLDKNTAMYAMQIYTGVGTVFERDYGAAGVVKFRIVGLLAGSTFQGSLLVPEKHLLKHFPRVGGYRYFMVQTEDPVAVAGKLEENYSDEGLDLTDSNRLLTELLAVQNTYLSTFQSLGGLGLLLGTFGLAAVQLRNVVQRRGELALLRAAGFRNQQLSLLVLREHAILLFGGLAVGIIAAFLVVFPHMIFGGASVPIGSLVVMLGLVAIVGLTSAFFAQRYLQKMPLLPALRGD